jgi:hypothetical protein
VQEEPENVVEAEKEPHPDADDRSTDHHDHHPSTTDDPDATAPIDRAQTTREGRP